MLEIPLVKHCETLYSVGVYGGEFVILVDLVALRYHQCRVGKASWSAADNLPSTPTTLQPHAARIRVEFAEDDKNYYRAIVQFA